MTTESTNRYQLYETVPMNHVFWDVLDGILQVKPVTMPIQRPLVAILKPDLVHAVAKRQLASTLRNSIQTLPIADLCQ